jgi:hypothetical protein
MKSETETEYVDYMSRNQEWFGLCFDTGPRYGRIWHSPWYDNPEARSTGFLIPPEPSAIAYITVVLPTLMYNCDPLNWKGGAVWYQDFDVWNHEANVAGWKMIERIRAGYGELRPFDQATVNIFKDDDRTILPAFLLAPLIYGWDAYYIPQERGSFARISHDGYWAIETETEEAYQAIQEKIKAFGQEHFLVKQRVLQPRRF